MFAKISKVVLAEVLAILMTLQITGLIVTLIGGTLTGFAGVVFVGASLVAYRQLHKVATWFFDL